MNRLMYVAIGIVILLIVLIIAGRKSVHHEIEINASTEVVWAVLMDTDNYHAWNPVMKLLEGKVIAGNRVKYQFTQSADSKYDIESNVKKIIPNQLLNQAGGVPLVLTFDHKYILEPSGTSTKLTIHEEYRGIGVNFWNPKPVELAYGRLNAALKARVEGLTNQ